MTRIIQKIQMILHGEEGCKHTNTEEIPAVAATCTATGKTAGTRCVDCKEILVNPIDTLVKEHSYGDWVTTKEATCEEAGTKERTCNYKCGATETDTIPANGHNIPKEGIIVKEATCKDTGILRYTCIDCTLFKDYDIPLAEHNKLDECSYCGGKFCSWCGYNWDCTCDDDYCICDGITDEYDYTLTEPTCEDDGVDIYTCDCGYYYDYVPVDALGHDDIYEEEVAPTCTEWGFTAGNYCTRGCYNTIVRILASGHTEVIDEAVEATCTETGLTEGEHCSVCEEVFVEQEIIPALGHDLVDSEGAEPTCTLSGTAPGKYCLRCEYEEGLEYLSPLGHDLADSEGAEPTCTLSGTAPGKYCLRCEYEEGLEYLPPLGHDYEYDGHSTHVYYQKCKNCGDRIATAI